MKLTKEQIEYNKKEVITLLQSTNRDGVEGLLKVMEKVVTLQLSAISIIIMLVVLCFILSVPVE